MASTPAPDRPDILALLEPGPCSRETVAERLRYPMKLLRLDLLWLVRAGKLKRVGQHHDYALVSYVPKLGRRVVPGPRRTSTGRLLCARCERKQAKHSGLCRACAREAGAYITSFQVERDRAERRIVRHQANPPRRAVNRAPQPLTIRVIDGVEYQVVDYEALLRKKATHWPSSGSSLSAPFHERPRLSSEARRGAHS